MMDLYPLKAQYLRNEEITLRLELQEEKFNNAVIQIYMLEKEALVKEIRTLSEVTDIRIIPNVPCAMALSVILRKKTQIMER